MTEDCGLQPVEQDSRLVYGQFAFAKGPLFILSNSASLVREILANRSVTAEANITIGVDEQRTLCAWPQGLGGRLCGVCGIDGGGSPGRAGDPPRPPFR